ncbi:regulator of G-protein signaling 12 isoform X2 [Corythoichthys intestinalis]|uniref:regulator of G-protein signaling 12 isoform X2 n=1 Tax=Corythoichthys intestinalis TaxID=161448 RepID=UPI0025A5E846|nr:regulator of G-protein signaling 12 isoform X2 [Corythoichthys intestinalis]
MRIREGAERRPDLRAGGELRRVEVDRGRAGYGFTVSGQRPCLLSDVLEGSGARLAGLQRGDGIVAVAGTDVSDASRETVVRMIGRSVGPLRLVVRGEGRVIGNPILHDEKFLISPEKVAVLRDDRRRSPAKKQRPLSAPDMSPLSRERYAFTDGEETGSVFNTTLVVGYLSSTELILNTRRSEDDGLKAIRDRIRQLGTEQDTHTLVVMKLTSDCVRLCDDAGVVLAAFPAENLLLGAVCAEDPRFFCLVTTAHVIDGRVARDVPLRASCHVFFIDPDLADHAEHAGIAARFDSDCGPDPDASSGCPEFPRSPPEVLRFVTALYSDMGDAVERLRAELEAEARQRAEENGGGASSNGDSGIDNASPPEDRAARDFPSLIPNCSGVLLPTCPRDNPASPDRVPFDFYDGDQTPHPGHGGGARSLSESLPGPDSLAGFYGGPPPRLRFRFKPPPPPFPPLGQKTPEPLKASRRWFRKPKWSKPLGGDPEPRAAPHDEPPPASRIPPDEYGSAELLPMMPPEDEWTRAFAERKNHCGKNGSRFWGLGVLRASKRRTSKRLSLARSLDDLESAASSDGDYSGGVQLQGCCSHSSLNSNGSLPGSRRGLPEQRVAGWAACFERLLQDPVGVRYFSEFLKKEFSEENILFWQACEYFSHVPATDKKQLSRRAGEIYDSFLSSEATMPVNIDSQAQLADDVLTSPRPEMFKTQQLQIFNLMKFDSYSRFLKSSLYQECTRAEADGLPLPDPYRIPCSPAPSKHSAGSDRSALSTPKKDAGKQRSGGSLAEDGRDEGADRKRGIFFSWSRNRSFGKGPKKKDVGDIDLDYWGSNGRRESQGSLSSSTSLDMATSCSAGKMESDNRHSAGAWERSPKRCNVTLPDGSRSSVTLRSGASVRELLQILCHGIGVNVAAVDLFLVGGEKPLVLDQDCMTLSSRDLRLEKRTLFRLDLVPINRSVGLKAKPGKPVAEVLRPVAAKYGLPLADLVVKISGRTEPLDLGAPISTLDGLRVVLERADAPPCKDASKSAFLKNQAPPGSLSAANSSSC